MHSAALLSTVSMRFAAQLTPVLCMCTAPSACVVKVQAHAMHCRADRNLPCATMRMFKESNCNRAVAQVAVAMAARNHVRMLRTQSRSDALPV